MKYLILSGLLLVSLLTKAQNCEMYFPSEEGTQLDYENYNAKGKLEGKSSSKIIKKEVNGTAVILTVQASASDEKGKELGKRDYKLTCDNGIFTIDMKSLMDNKTMEGFKDMEVNVTSEDLQLPGALSVGQTLKDAKMTITVSNQGMTLMTMSTFITNRKVAAVESITTPAGTFQCLKITYDIESKTIMTVKMKGIDWFAKDVGSVKTETYDSRDKLQGYTLLTGKQ